MWSAVGIVGNVQVIEKVRNVHVNSKGKDIVLMPNSY